MKGGWVMGTEEKMLSMLFLHLGWRLVARNGDQPQHFLITNGFARMNSDRQADSSWGNSKADHMFICFSFS